MATFDVLLTEDGHPILTEDGVELTVEGIGHLLVQAIVTPIGAAYDGNVVELVGPVWRAILDELDRDPSLRFQIGSRKWEEMIAAAYDAAGYRDVVLTPASNDHGYDVRATSVGRFPSRLIVSVKALGEDKKVPYDDIRALGHVISADHAASTGVLTTTGKFPPNVSKDPLLAPYFPTRIRLIDGEELIEWLRELRKAH
ncbi:MAG TPA: restriction endonuclease [Polyangiaceae bacterium]|jgi:restriction system protein|nr:restriction endonuclease [Polyangiaceae bacterium]